MKNIIITLLFICVIFNISWSQNEDDNEYAEALMEYFEVSGHFESMKSMLNLNASHKNPKNNSEGVDFNNPSGQTTPNNLWDIYFTDESKTYFVSLAIPLYKKYLNLQDLKDLNAFFKTPAGKKYTKLETTMMFESMEIYKDWFNWLGQKGKEKKN